LDAIALLTADHNRVRGLFSRFRTAHEESNDTEMIELAAKIFQELEVHTTIEEEIFYPDVHDRDEEIAETVDEGIQEHHVVKVLMEELQQVEPASDEWVAKMTVLMENVEHHAEEEESELFPSVRSELGAEPLEQMAVRLEERKASLGAPVLADKIDLSKQELQDLASEQEIPGRSKMSQEELAATVAPA
jgi:hemerythrin superfamily protein